MSVDPITSVHSRTSLEDEIRPASAARPAPEHYKELDELTLALFLMFKEVSYAHQGDQKHCKIIKYYYNVKQMFSM